MFLRTSLLTGLLPAISLFATTGVFAQPQGAFPASRPGQGAAFDFNQWRAKQAAVTFEQHNANHPGPHGGWFGADDDKCAKSYHITWGPLGIRTLMHDHSWAAEPAFKRAWPKSLLNADGELLYDCFEVLHVIPGSPADGHLQVGDLLVAMDGGLFRTAKTLRPNLPEWQHQGSRGLEMDAGERLDLAEGRGSVSFDVIRPAGVEPAAATLPVITKEVFVSKEIPQQAGTEVELDIPVAPGQEMSLLLEITRAHNGSCGATLIRPRLEGAKGSLDLTNFRSLGERSGWASVKRGEGTYKDQPVKESIWYHAPGTITWAIPPGYNRFRATLLAPGGAVGYRARGVVRAAPVSLPEPLRKLHRVVAFDIPRIGSYGRGFPGGNDAKSATVARMTAAWLADHQKPDGSWPRNVGYTHRGYDTAYAGLGLLAQADPAYDTHIRKAAEFIAFQCPQDHWAVPTSVMAMFLSEYWLRTHDDRVLPPLAGLVSRMTNEMLYGDFTSGHGGVPGYRGTGVSIGGSHVALALSLAELTPAKPEEGLVDRMLARAQELGPDGYIPYGRGTQTRSFEPNLKDGPTYSGRHAPYLIASRIHGGPRLFTENCSAIYARGPVGGIDQGHATQTLSTSWGLIASAVIGPETLARQMEALRWKFTMLRCHDGGFGWNAYRLEYQGGEGLLPPYLRSGALLIALNAPKRNLAITGAPKWQAKQFPDLPPVCHEDAVALAYYQRNWGVAASVLGDQAPPSLASGLARLLGMGKTRDTRGELFGFLKSSAAPVARDIMGLKTADPRLRQYLAEMVLGVDLRLSVEPEMKNEKPVAGMWKIKLHVQHPLAGYFDGAAPGERDAWRKSPPLSMSGSMDLLDTGGGRVLTSPLVFKPDCGNHPWQTQELGADLSNESPPGKTHWIAHFQYRVGDITFDYKRPLIAGAEEPGGGEKDRKITGDRVVMVRGRLARELSGWNASFFLPTGQYISAASQGNAIQVKCKDESWVAPDAGSVPANAAGDFGFSSGWQPYEARVGTFVLLDDPRVLPVPALVIDGASRDSEPLMDRDPATGVASTKGSIELNWNTPVLVSALDLRVRQAGSDKRLRIEAPGADGGWQVLYAGVVSDRLRSFPPVKTKQLRISIGAAENPPKPLEITELVPLTVPAVR